jgi:hypothetical protein
MHDKPIYSYNLSGRRPATIMMFAITILFIVAGLAYDAPWYFFAPVALSLFMAIWAIIANPQTGIILTKDTLHIYNRHHKRDVDVCEIRSVKIDNDMDGGTHADLLLASGEKIGISAMCMNIDLGPALESLGVNVTLAK